MKQGVSINATESILCWSFNARRAINLYVVCLPSETGMHPPLQSALGPILCKLMLAFCMLPLFQCLYVPWRCWFSEPYFLDVLLLLWFLLSFSLLYCRVWWFLLGNIHEYSILHCTMDSLSRAEVLETSETIHWHSLLLGVVIHTEIWVGWISCMSYAYSQSCCDFLSTSVLLCPENPSHFRGPWTFALPIFLLSPAIIPEPLRGAVIQVSI